MIAPGSSTHSVQRPPPFGQADLSNCDRELIHLAGSVQPHGVLWVLQEPQLRIVQASNNSTALLGRPLPWLVGALLAELGGDAAERVQELLAEEELAEGAPLRCRIRVDGREIELEGQLHRGSDGALIAELEPLGGAPAAWHMAATVALEGPELLTRLSGAVQRLSEASTIGTLADAVVRSVRELVGYDRVMVYKFDPEGHGKIIAEARDMRLDSLLGHHYPATDIPQRARDLYIRNRVRVLVDVDYVPAAIEPRLRPAGGGDLDMSMCYLRSMSPLHLQYLKNMGVTATLVVSLVREGKLWGLIACHHYQPRNLRAPVRAAADLIAEVTATRITAIENYARAQVAIQVRRLEQRLVEATSTEGDWRLALFRHPGTLLQPLEATGAALFHEGQTLSCGEAPSTPELRALLQWVETQPFVDGAFACSSVVRANPALASLTPTASGVLAVRLSNALRDGRPDLLLWFRKEQLLSVTWAGNPAKPMVNDDPLELSPRRSFAAWSELVRGTSQPWTGADIALGRAFGDALVDIIVQVNAVRLLIAEHQLAQVRASVTASMEAVVVADTARRVFYANDAFLALARCTREDCASLNALLARFVNPALAQQAVAQAQAERRAWRGELALQMDGGQALPVALRAEPVPARDGSLLGLIFIFEDLTENKRADAARDHLEASLSKVGRGLDGRPREGGSLGADELIAAILTNASLAAMDIADGGALPAVAPLLEELESSTRRATSLYTRIRHYAQGAAPAERG